jgi:hypothetical protein
MAGIACGRFAATNFNELKTLIFSPLFVDECLKFVPRIIRFLSVFVRFFYGIHWLGINKRDY